MSNLFDISVMDHLGCPVVMCDPSQEAWPVVYANPSFWEWVMVAPGDTTHSIVEFLEDPILADPSRIDHDGRHVILKWRHNDTRWEEQITYLIRLTSGGESRILFCFYPYELRDLPDLSPGPDLPGHNGKKMMGDKACGDEAGGDETWSDIPDEFSNLEALGQLSAGIAHDFNNILSVIEGFTHMAMQRIKNGRPAGELLAKSLAATRRGASLTRQLLAFGQQRVLTDGRVKDLRPLIGQPVELCQPLLPPGIDITLSMPDDPLPVEGDGNAIAQIITNLITNARDAVDDQGGKIDITLYPPSSIPAHINNKLEAGSDKNQQGKFACIEIRDNGHGIDEKQLRHIFNPFYTTKDAGAGTGLGLSIVYGMAHQLGGDVRVESRVGQSTSFYVLLPLTDKEMVAVDNPSDIANNGDATAKLPSATVLLVEDGDDLRDILTQQLRGYGLRVLAAKNGNHALSVEDSHDGPIHILLTDVIMPELDGFHLAQIFVELRPEAKVIFISGQPLKGDGWNDHIPDNATILTKPVAPQVLYTECKSQLERKFER